jgi:hypothetical protein
MKATANGSTLNAALRPLKRGGSLCSAMDTLNEPGAAQVGRGESESVCEERREEERPKDALECSM